ncbi:MAG: hypothetical protein IPP13_11675 [Kouleothrix sp.]|nr:hypothetical protein [Kouleothrix sp.]
MQARVALKHIATLRFWQAALAALTLDRFLLLAALVLVFVAAAIMGVQSDTWWQLRAGEMIVRTGRIPITDPFSSTVPGGYWPNHEWLAELLFYAGYSLGGLPLLYLVCAALTTVAWYGMAQLGEGPWRARALALLAGLPSQSVIWSVRPHMISLALTAATLVLLPRRRLHWLYPPLFLLWANAHAGVAFGGVILVVACLVALVHDLPQWRAQPWHAWPSTRLALATLLSALATLINPLGLGLWRYVLASFGDTTRTYMSEWQPPSLDLPASYPFFVLVGLCAVALLAAWRSWYGPRDWTLIVLALLFGLLGFRSIRHTAVFGLVAVPLLTRPFRGGAPMPAGQVRQGALNAALLLLLAGGGTLLIGRQWASTAAPALSGQVVAAVRRCEGVLYNTYDAGGPLIWLVPERPVFVDNRQDPYPAALLFAAVIAEQRGEYRELFAAYQVRCALAPLGGPLDTALRRSGWRMVGGDERFAVLALDGTIP